jgi:hypothetical protein
VAASLAVVNMSAVKFMDSNIYVWFAGD